MAPRAPGAAPALLLLLGLLALAAPCGATIWCSEFWEGDLAPLGVLNNSVLLHPVSNYSGKDLTLECLFVLVTSPEPSECPGPQNYTLTLQASGGGAWDLKPYVFQPPHTFTAAAVSTWQVVVQNTNPSACWEAATISIGFAEYTLCSTHPKGKPPACAGHGTCNLRDSNCSCWDSTESGHWAGDMCDGCSAIYHGPNCTGHVTCTLEHGTCNPGTCYGTTGSGHCDTCLHAFAGRDCELSVTCNATNGKCGDTCTGPNGTGVCEPCSEGWYDRNCAQAVRCDPGHGVCGSDCYGTKGTGYCTTCKFPFAGNDCSSSFGGFYVAIGLLGVCLVTTVALLVHTAFRRRAVEGERANLLSALRVNATDYDGSSVAGTLPGSVIVSTSLVAQPTFPVDVSPGYYDHPPPSLNSFPTSLTPSMTPSLTPTTRKLLSSSPERPKRHTVAHFGEPEMR